MANLAEMTFPQLVDIYASLPPCIARKFLRDATIAQFADL